MTKAPMKGQMPRAPASTFVPPWVVKPEYVTALPKGAQNAWAMVSPDVLMLEPRINRETYNELTHDLQSLYRAIYKGAPKAAGTVEIDTYTDEPTADPHAFWLDIGLCPRSERIRWKQLPAKANFEEAKTLLEYLELYRFTGGEGGDTETFRLRDAHKPWMTVDEE